jgi:hypothetical protein
MRTASPHPYVTGPYYGSRTRARTTVPVCAAVSTTDDEGNTPSQPSCWRVAMTDTGIVKIWAHQEKNKNPGYVIYIALNKCIS